MTGDLNSNLANNSDIKLDISVDKEACPLNLAPTSSTTMSLIIGDSIAITLLKMRGFRKSNFSNFHPGGNIGKDLVKLSEVMHHKSA